MVAAKKYRSVTQDLTADYDRRADVLYVLVGAPVEAEGDGRPDGIELNFTVADDTPCGVTVIGFKRYGWPDRLAALADLTAKHLSVQPSSVLEHVKHAVSQASA